MRTDIKQKRLAIIANRAGFENATDGQIHTIFDALLPEVQRRYLESIKEAAVSKKRSATESTETTEKR